MTQRTAPRDHGFTLVELVITITIVGIIAVPLGNLMISYFLNAGTTTGRLNESHDEQVVAAYFSEDVATMGVRDSDLNPQQSVWPGSFPAGSCGSATAANQVLLLKSDDLAYTPGASSAVSTVNSVAYVIATSASGERQLHRVFCAGSVQRSDVVVVHNLDPGHGPAATCSTACSGSPASVDLRVWVKSRSGAGDAYDFTVTGTRRQATT